MLDQWINGIIMTIYEIRNKLDDATFHYDIVLGLLFDKITEIKEKHNIELDHDDTVIEIYSNLKVLHDILEELEYSEYSQYN